MTADAPRSVTENPFDAWADLLPLWGRFAGHGDISFYSRLAATHGRPSVELGIGYGRVARHIEPDFGVDASLVMLKRAACQAPGTRLIHGDLQTYALPEPTRFAYAPLNMFDGIPSDAVVGAVLERIHDQSAPDGYLAFDGELPDPALGEETARIVRLSAADRTVAIFAAHDVIDAVSGAVEITAFVDYLDAEGHVLARRYFPAMPYRARPPELWEQLLRRAGWEPAARWGGFDGEPLAGAVGRQVWLARRA